MIEPTVAVASFAIEEAADLPAGQRLYCIGDLHGRADLLDALLQCIDHHMKIKPVDKACEIHLGDMIDRGPDSRRVLEILSGKPVDRTRVLLRGNHEQRLLDLLANAEDCEQWLYEGGYETLLSYGVPKDMLTVSVDSPRVIRHLQQAMGAHVEVLRATKIWHEMSGFLFVHAGVDPSKSFEDQNTADMLMIREPFLSHKARWDYCVVHGHTPSYNVTRGPHRIGIDTGAYATGKLTCLVLDPEGSMTITITRR
jgi:serine/threonine protein phosphatase 1